MSDEKCVLFLGPEVCRNADDQPYYRLQATQLQEQMLAQVYYEPEDLFLFPDRISQAEAYYSVIQPLYAKPGNMALYEQIAAIPFHLIISLSPDLFLKQTLETMGLPFSFGYFNKNRTDPTLPKPAKDRPLLYNLFGSSDDEESLILTHDDLFDYLAALFGQGLPETLSAALLPANIRNLIFLGFPLHKWYIQLLLRLLQLHKYKDRFKAYAAGLELDQEVKTLCLEHFHINFVRDQTQGFVQKLYTASQEQNLLRAVAQTPQSKSDGPEVFISYAWGEPREGIVNDLYNSLTGKGYNVIRDKVHLGYKGRIKEFMQRIGRGKYVILVISDKYLKSENCMYEVLEIEKKYGNSRPHLSNRPQRRPGL